MTITHVDPGHLSARLETVVGDLSSDPARATVELTAIAHEARQDEQWAVVGLALHHAARGHVELGEDDVALQMLAEASHAHVRAGDRFSSVRMVLGRMHVLDNQGRHEAAIAAGAEALEFIETARADGPVGDWNWLEAAISENSAISLGLIGRHTEALRHLEAARRAFDAAGAAGDERRARANIGVQLLEVGQCNEAIRALAAVAEEFASEGNQWWHGVASAYLARAHLGAGAPERARLIADAARVVLRDLDAAPELLKLDLVAASCDLSLGKWREAGATALSAVVTASRDGRQGERALGWFLLGLSFSERGRLAAARRCLTRAIDAAADADRFRLVARACVARAEIAEDHGDVTRDLQRARAQVSIEDAPLEHVRTLLVGSRWLVGEVRVATLAHARTLAGASCPAGLSTVLGHELGSALLETGDTDGALAHLRSARSTERRRRRLVASADAWLGCGDRRDVDAALVSALVATDSPGALDEALRVIEERKLSLRGRRSARALPATSIGEAVSFHDDGVRLLALFSMDGHVVDAAEVDRDEVALASAQIWAAAEASVAGRLATHTSVRLLGAMTRLSELLTPWVSDPHWPTGPVVSQSLDGIVTFSPSVLSDRAVVTIERPSLASVGRMRRTLASSVVIDCGATDLPHSAREIAAVADIWNDCDVACPSTIGELGELARRHDVIHLVGHTVSGRDGRPRLRVAGETIGEQDLLSLDLDGQLFVLDVCDAHRRTISSARLAGGLADSLLAAGAGAVIGSHFPVVDRVGAELSISLHGALAEGLLPADALARAVDTVRAHEPHPLAWAGWTIRTFTSINDLAQEVR